MSSSNGSQDSGPAALLSGYGERHSAALTDCVYEHDIDQLYLPG